MEEENNCGFNEHHDQHQTQDQNNYHQDPNNNNYGPSDHQPQYYHQDQAPPPDPQQQQPPPQQQAAGTTQTSSVSAQIGFSYQTTPPPPGPARPVQYHQPNPAYVNPVHRPNYGTPPNPGVGGGGGVGVGGGGYYQPPPGSPMKPGSGDHQNGAPLNAGVGSGGVAGYYQPPGSPMKPASGDYQNGGGYNINNNYNNTGGPMGGNYGNQPGHGGGAFHPARPAPGFPVQPGVGTEPWRSGLFDCMNDPSNALVTALCPCITFGQIAEIIDKGNSTCATSGLIYGVLYSVGLPCVLSYAYRTKVRNEYGLAETPAPDFLTHALCEWCAVCQLYRELRDRGLDPAMGWQGNVAKMNLEALQRNNQVQMTPPMHERMMMP